MSNLAIFRIIAFLEGLSYILLLGIAMPLKHMYGMPMAVSVIGMIHGILFMVYCAYLIVILKEYTLRVPIGVRGFIAGLLPFGTFVFDGYIRRQKEVQE
tara:strand:+ start:121 stop:417 length:297 start_codon:yes stop_codon:yes gene_type:complete